jgi:hypothetical protein
MTRGDQLGRRGQGANYKKPQQGGEYEGEQIPERGAVPSLVCELSDKATEKCPRDSQSSGNEERSHGAPVANACVRAR